MTTILPQAADQGRVASSIGGVLTRRRPGWATKHRVAAMVLTLGLPAAGSWLGAFASYTDNVAASSTFTSSDVKIRANGAATTYAFTSLGVTGLVPGAPAKYALLEISNAGSAPLTYTMSTTATANQLSTDLRIGVVRIAGSTCDAAAFTGGTNVYTEAAGLAAATIAARPLAGAAAESLCFKVALPVSSTNASAGLNSTATFTFAASS